jgi:toxin-antitoxin system PIN domain toxin
MILPDVNVLIYAFRPDVPQHAVCNRWLTNIIASEPAFGISPLALGALVRITSNARIYKTTSTLDEAFKFCDYLMDQPHCQTVQPGATHWNIFKRLCIETNTRGRRVTDAWFAALAIEWGCDWITMDRDYARFPGLRWAPPTV